MRCAAAPFPHGLLEAARVEAVRLAFALAAFPAPVALAGEAAKPAPADPRALFAPQAAREWKPLDGSPPVEAAGEKTPDGTPAVRFACPMARVAERAYWDRAIALDLAGVQRLRFWLHATGDPGAVSGATLYLRSGAGWYGAPIDFGFDRWTRVAIEAKDFKPEGSPAGFSAVSAVRVSFWKGGEGRADVLAGGFEAFAPSVAIVRNERGGGEAVEYANRAAAIFERAGVEAGMLDDADVEAGKLSGKRVAVCPHNPKVSAKEFEALEAFVRSGGKLLVCFSLDPRLAKLLEVEVLGFLKQSREGEFAAIRAVPPPAAGGAEASRIRGLPEEARQASWNIFRVRPAGRSRVVARWHDAAGADTGHAAIVLGPAGAYVSHVLLPDDPERKSRLVRALLGALAPELWDAFVRGALARASRISSWEDFDEAARGIAALAEAAGKAEAVRPLLARARSLRDEALALARDGRHPKAISSADSLGEALLEAFARAQAPRPGEFRAFWCHSAYGPKGMDWDAAIRLLAESGFTAVIPNMLWAGVADYPSRVLPVRDRVRAEGDPVARCLAACRKHGVEMHVWKVNWNLSGAPAEFVEKMRREGRLQRDRDGREVTWLCPSHPENFSLEVRSMLEVAERYLVDGLHFDYIRYPDEEKCTCDGCRKRFEDARGKKVAEWPRDVLPGGRDRGEYEEFRRAQISRLVRAVSEEARRTRPGIRVSAAVFSNWPRCRDSIGQDWVRWAEEGLLDFVCPMDYTASSGAFRARVRIQRDALRGRIPFYPGIGASAPGLPADVVIDQVRTAREEEAPGFVIFNFDGVVAERYAGILGRGLTAR
ncbi:MAG: glycoside hydrolase family 10 protein [Planctomycetota bacterium]